MANLVPMQSRLGELSALETNLWRAFKGAEAKYIPPSLNPWSVTANFLRLRRQGYLRLYEFYPLYGLVAISAATAAVRGIHWMFVVYIAALLPMFVFLGKYVKQFAFEKTNLLGLDRCSFGVANLPLLVYGMAKIVSEKSEPVKDIAPAPLTKENLASVPWHRPWARRSGYSGRGALLQVVIAEARDLSMASCLARVARSRSGSALPTGTF